MSSYGRPVPDPNSPDEAVQARLRTVMTAEARPRRAAPDAVPHAPVPHAPVPHGAPPSTGSTPPWARDLPPPPTPGSAVRTADLAGRGPSAALSDGSPGGHGATAKLTGLGAFDPGRRGVKALASVTAVVVLVAAFLAWRARPKVEAVPTVPVAEARPSDSPGDRASTARPPTDPAAAGAVPAASAAGTEMVVAVGGKVRRPGLVRLPPGSRVADALQRAGGPDRGVDVALLNLARKVVDGELILVGVTPPPGQATGAGGPAAGAAAPAGGPVNLNTATLADLDTLPGVGPVLAQRILDEREQRGGFTAVADLRKVQGIGSSRYEQLKDLVTV